MKKLESLAEYKNIINEFKSVCKRPFSNLYYMPNDIERYIELGRARYEKSESGIVFFFDEETYYRACLYANINEKISIDCQDKKVLVKNVYQEGKKRENLLCAERQLEELGFEKVGVSVKYQGEVPQMFQSCKQMEKYVEVLERKGYHCRVPDASMIEEIETIIFESDVIKDYQLDYWTNEEKKRGLENGFYLCIVNADNQICAAEICKLDDDISEGLALAVREKYRMHGLAPMIVYHRFSQLYHREIKRMQGWILTDNEPSLRYHKSIGYKFTNEYADEWILRGK